MSDSVSRRKVAAEEVLKVARILFGLAGKSRVGKRPLGESFIDGAFYLTFFEQTFMPRVKGIRRCFWQTEEPPLPHDPAMMHWPLAGPKGFAEYRSPSWSDDEYASFSAAINSLGEDFAIPGYAEEVVLYGVPPAFPFLKYSERVDVFTEQVSIELRVYSARTTGKQVSEFFRDQISAECTHVPRFPHARGRGDFAPKWKVERGAIPRLPYAVLQIPPPWPSVSALERYYDSEVRTKGALRRLYCGRVARVMAGPGRLPARQGQVEQIRSLAIFTLKKRAAVPVHQAMKSFTQQFPTETYSNFDATAGESQSPETQFLRERRMLLTRMPFLGSRL